MSSTSSTAHQTPHVLLSRDPAQLARELDLSLADVLKVRARVAANIINIFPRTTAPDISNNDTSQIPAFSTALDVCIQRSVLLESSRRNMPYSIITTGSQTLDALLSPSSTNMVDGGPACTFHPVIVSKTISSHRKRRFDDTTGLSPTESDDESGPFPSLHDMHEMTSNHHGLFPGYILEVSGPPSSGKTQLALTMATNAILGDKPWSVRYLAGSSVAFTSLARRVRQICHSLTSKTGLSKAACEKAFHRVSFYPVSDMFQLLSALSTMEEEIQQCPKDPNILIILDSISGIFLSSSSLDTATDGGTSAALLSAVALSLRRLSRSGSGTSPGVCTKHDSVSSHYCMARQCAVVVTNGTVSGRIKIPTSTGHGFYSKPALGDSWKVADIRLALEVEGDDYPEDSSANQISSNRRVRVYLTKHWLKRCNTLTSSTLIGINRSGIVDL